MSEDLLETSFARPPTAAQSSGATARQALMAWLSNPADQLGEHVREMTHGQLTRLLSDIGEVLRRQEAKFTSMQEIGSALGQTIQLDELLTLIMDKITRLMDAERSTLFLVDQDTDELWSKVAQGGVNTEIRMGLGQGLAGWVATTGKSINVRDAYNDPRFNPAVDLETGFTTHNMLCQPVRNQDAQIIGVVQVLNCQSGAFSDQDENLLSAIASQTAVAIENSKLYLSVVDKNIELRRTHRELEKKISELDLLYEVERELSAALDLDELIETITQKTLDRISACASALTLREDTQNRMYILVDRARSCPDTPGPADDVETGDHDWEFSTNVIAHNDGIAGRVIETGQAFRCDAHDCGDIAQAAADQIGVDVQTIICVPLFDEDTCIGALQVMNRARSSAEVADDNATGLSDTGFSDTGFSDTGFSDTGFSDTGFSDTGFSDADHKILTLIAAQIAGTVASRRHRQQQQKAQRLATIGQMLTGVVHDLKNPIAVISGNVQLMAKADDRAKRDEYAASVQKQFKHLNQMTRELLAFARGDSDIDANTIDLGEFFDDVSKLLSPEMSDADIDFRTRLDYDGPGWFDAGKMKRAIINLARNAAEAMSDGGVFEMGVGLDAAADELVFSCSDTGPGIPDEIQHTLFESFVTRGKQHGTGLGLAIVQKIVDQHNGTVSYESSVTDGTTFFIRLPRRDDMIARGDAATEAISQ